MAPPQKPETFMLSDSAQQNLPQDAQVALQQVDNRKLLRTLTPDRTHVSALGAVLHNMCGWPSRSGTDDIGSQILPHLRTCGLDT